MAPSVTQVALYKAHVQTEFANQVAGCFSSGSKKKRSLLSTVLSSVGGPVRGQLLGEQKGGALEELGLHCETSLKALELVSWGPTRDLCDIQLLDVWREPWTRAQLVWDKQDTVVTKLRSQALNAPSSSVTEVTATHHEHTGQCLARHDGPYVDDHHSFQR